MISCFDSTYMSACWLTCPVTSIQSALAMYTCWVLDLIIIFRHWTLLEEPHTGYTISISLHLIASSSRVFVLRGSGSSSGGLCVQNTARTWPYLFGHLDLTKLAQWNFVLLCEILAGLFTTFGIILSCCHFRQLRFTATWFQFAIVFLIRDQRFCDSGEDLFVQLERWAVNSLNHETLFDLRNIFGFNWCLRSVSLIVIG